MDLRRYLFAAAVSLFSVWSAGAYAKNKCVPEIYAFGFAASFNDSIIYISDVQAIKDAWVSDKAKFLLGRDNYSYQLRNYLESKGFPHRTCIIVYSLKRKDVEKKYRNLKAKYTKKGNFDIRYLHDADFHFTTIDNSEEEAAPENKDKGKKKGKNRKERPAKQPVVSEEHSESPM